MVKIVNKTWKENVKGGLFGGEKDSGAYKKTKLNTTSK